MSDASTNPLSSCPPVPSAGWKRARRIGVSILLIAATVLLGVIIGALFADLVRDSSVKSVLGIIPLKWGLAGIGLTYILASFEKVLKFANTFREYIAIPDKKVSLFPDCTALASIVAYVTIVAIVPTDNAEGAGPSQSKEIVYLTRTPQIGDAAVDYFPFLFTDLATEKDPSKGTSLTGAQVEDLKRLVASLKACVGNKPGEDVELDVRGYADANEFPSNSLELNRQAANRRGKELHRQLKLVIGNQSGVAVVLLRDFEEWPEKDPLAMKRERYFKTLPFRSTGRENDQGLFNRRADLIVLRLGVCDRLK